jgi:hypothetical protein
LRFSLCPQEGGTSKDVFTEMSKKSNK